MAYSKLFAVQEGDCMLTFGGFSCIGPNVVVQIYRDETGLYFVCAEGKHYLESQIDQDGQVLGLTGLV